MAMWAALLLPLLLINAQDVGAKQDGKPAAQPTPEPHRATVLEKIDPIWVRGHSDIPLSMDLFLSRIHGPLCVCSVSALRSLDVKGRRLDPSRALLSAPALGIRSASPTLYRASDVFESVTVSFWCIDADAESQFLNSSQSNVSIALAYGGKSWRREIPYDRESLHGPGMQVFVPHQPSFAVFTLFRPDAGSGTAWLQMWLTLGASHVYLYLNANTTSLTGPATARLEALLAAFPRHVTMMPWPFDFYAGERNFGIVTGLTSAFYRWGHLYTHVCFFDFDEYPVFGGGEGLPLLLPGRSSAKAAFTAAPRNGASPPPPPLGNASALAFLERYRNFEWIKLRQTPAVIVAPPTWSAGSNGSGGVEVGATAPGLAMRRWPGVVLDKRHKTFTRTPRGDAWAAGKAVVGPKGGRIKLPTNHGPFLKAKEESAGVVAAASSHAYFLHVMNIGKHVSIDGRTLTAWSAAATEVDAAFAAQLAAVAAGPFSRPGKTPPPT